MRNKILRLRTLNKEKRKLLFNKTCKENLHLMYSIVFWCLFIASAEFRGFVAWVTTWWDPGRSLDEFHQKCHFFPPKIPIRCNLFSSSTSRKSLLVLISNRLWKTAFISTLNHLRHAWRPSGFPMPMYAEAFAPTS